MGTHQTPAISVVIVAKNEGQRIAACIASVQSIAEEILVADTGSKDDTVEKAKAAGAKTIHLTWEGFGQTKNAAAAQAKNPWILSLDADEQLDNELIHQIQQLDLINKSVYVFNRLTFLMDQPIKHSGWFPDWVPRLYHRDDAQWSLHQVHEKLLFDSNINPRKLKGLVLHYSYSSLDHYRHKMNHYAQLKAKEWIDTNRSVGWIDRHLRPTFKFFQTLILKNGWMDGRAGWTIARMNYLLAKRQCHYFDQFRAKPTH